MAQLMPLPLTVSCFSKIQIGLLFWYWLTWVVPEKGLLNGCVCVCELLVICLCIIHLFIGLFIMHNRLGNMKRSLASCPLSECTGCHQKARMSSETLLQQYPSALTWGCWLTKADLCNSHKVVGCQERNPFQQNDQWSFPLGVLIWTLWKIRLEKKCFFCTWYACQIRINTFLYC